MSSDLARGIAAPVALLLAMTVVSQLASVAFTSDQEVLAVVGPSTLVGSAPSGPFADAGTLTSTFAFIGAAACVGCDASTAKLPTRRRKLCSGK